eukprot:jgi/Chlat1/1537/Chrsp122S01824
MAHVQNQIRQNALIVPPVRGRVDPSLDRAAATAAAVVARTKEGKGKAPATDGDRVGEGATQRHAAGHTYDYFRDKWDRFNVEAALAEASSSDDENQPSGGISRAMRHANNNHNAAGPSTSNHKQEKTVKPQSHARNDPSRRAETQSSESLKEEGNRLFKSGRWKEAVELYGRSIAVQPSSVAHANRAMALMKLNRHKEAIADCTACIDLDSSYIKGYWRRATAHHTLGNNLQAVLDFESALRLEPTSRELNQERKKAKEQYLKESGLKPTAKPDVIDVIEEKDGEDPLVMDEAAHSFPDSPQGLEERVEAARSQPASTSYAKPAAISVVSSAPDEPEIRELPSVVSPSLQARNKNSTLTSPTLDQSAANAARAAAEKARSAVAQAMQPPSSAYEFEVSWKALAGDMHAQANYLKMIPPRRLPAVFKDSLTAVLLTQLLNTLQLHFVPSDASVAADIATELSHVARFDMLIMLLPAKDRAVVRALWDAIASDTGVPTDVKGRFDALRIKYRIK